MMRRYGAKVENGIVTDVLVVADGAEGDEAVEAFGLVEQPGVRPGLGWTWDGSQFTPPADTWDDIRNDRDARLKGSDWTQVADAPVDAQAWADYRQALRDVPQTFAAPDEVVWPTAP